MSIEENKRVIQQFIDRFNANDAAALDSLADDATWWISGKKDQNPAAGTYTKAQIAQLLTNMASQLPNGLKITIKNLIAEGDQVAMEAESYGELRNGRVYNQQYHFLITLREGKIASVKEYLDTQHVFAIWFQQES